MSRLIYKFLFLAFIVISLNSCTSHGRGEERNEVKAEHENEQDGMEEYMKQQFNMTKDPALNYVPSERLAIARQEAERRSFSNRTNANLTWFERGPSNVGGRTRAILIDKSDISGNTVFAGSVGGGVWKCTNFKSANYSWTKVNDQMENLAVSCISQDPANPAVMYAGTGEGYYNADALRGGGIFKSTDGGSTWAVLPSTIPDISGGNYSFFYVQDIIVKNNGEVYATSRGYYCYSGGVFKSTDGGTTWNKVIGAAGAVSCSSAFNSRGNDLEIAANGDLYATTGLQGSNTTNYGHVFISPASLGSVQGDAGQWTDITPIPPAGEAGFRRIELACAPSSASSVYVLCQRYNNSDVTKFYKSSNSGTSWTAVTVPAWCDQGSTSSDFSRGQAWYDLIATYDPSNESNLYIGAVDVMKSVNGGTSFTQLTRWSSGGCGTLPVVHADIHNILFINGSPSDMIVSCDGGIFYSSNGGISFTARNNNYNVTQYYSVAMSPVAGSNYMLAGAQDNGSHKFTAAGVNSVSYASGGDGANCYIDQADPTYQITSYVYANYYISRNSGTSFGFSLSNSNGDFINPGDYDSQAKLLYCGYGAGMYGKVMNIVTGTPAMQPISLAAMNSQYASAFKVDPNTANRLYMGLSYSSTNLLRIDNANAASPAATDISIPGVNGYISSIDVENGDANHLLATLSNYGVASVFESMNGGVTWNNIEGDLPDMPVHAGLFLPSAVKRIALATEVGVWTTNSPAATPGAWQPDNAGMANVSAYQLKLRKSDSTVAVATHGRGVFTTSLGSLLPLKLIEFTGTLEDQHTYLAWKTASETNTSHFEVEKSFDGQHFSKIGKVAAAGNSSTTKKYSLTDKDKADAINYYRLNMVDLDGHSAYSNIILVKNNAVAQHVEVLNNPFKDYLDIHFSKIPAGGIRCRLINATGNIMQTQEFSGLLQNTLRMKFADVQLTKGVYTLVVFIGKERYALQVLKN